MQRHDQRHNASGGQIWLGVSMSMCPLTCCSLTADLKGSSLVVSGLVRPRPNTLRVSPAAATAGPLQPTPPPPALQPADLPAAGGQAAGHVWVAAVCCVALCVPVSSCLPAGGRPSLHPLTGGDAQRGHLGGPDRGIQQHQSCTHRRREGPGGECQESGRNQPGLARRGRPASSRSGSRSSAGWSSAVAARTKVVLVGWGVVGGGAGHHNANRAAGRGKEGCGVRMGA